MNDEVIEKIEKIVKKRKTLDYDDYCVGFHDFGIGQEIK